MIAALAVDLRWLDRHRAALAELARHVADPIAVTLALRRLAERDGDRLVDPLVAVLGTAAVHEAPTEARDVFNACGARLAGTEATRSIALPSERLGPIVLAWATALEARPEVGQLVELVQARARRAGAEACDQLVPGHGPDGNMRPGAAPRARHRPPEERSASPGERGHEGPDGGRRHRSLPART